MKGDLTVAETEAITEKFEDKLQAALEEVRDRRRRSIRRCTASTASGRA